MSNKLRLFIGSLTGIALASFLVAFSGQGQTNQRKPTSNQIPFGQTVKQTDDAATPIVDYDSPDGVDRIDKTKRKLKNARYDRGVLPKDPSPNIGDIRSEPERSASFSDLPAGTSDVVAEAIVGSSRAFLSDDKTGVYSEFTMVVAKVFKQVEGFSVNPGDTIIAERFGGKVRYPSGKVIRYRIEGEGMPVVGKRYIFFLAKADQDSYNLLTAYEIQGNKIFALDGSRNNARGQGNSIFDKHNGKDLDNFLREVGITLNKSRVQS